MCQLFRSNQEFCKILKSCFVDDWIVLNITIFIFSINFLINFKYMMKKFGKILYFFRIISPNFTLIYCFSWLRWHRLLNMADVLFSTFADHLSLTGCHSFITLLKCIPLIYLQAPLEENSTNIVDRWQMERC